MKTETKRDALSVLKSATNKITKIRSDIHNAAKRTEELRLRELLDLQLAAKDLSEEINTSVSTLQRCFRQPENDADSSAVTDSVSGSKP